MWNLEVNKVSRWNNKARGNWQVMKMELSHQISLSWSATMTAQMTMNYQFSQWIYQFARNENITGVLFECLFTIFFMVYLPFYLHLLIDFCKYFNWWISPKFCRKIDCWCARHVLCRVPQKVTYNEILKKEDYMIIYKMKMVNKIKDPTLWYGMYGKSGLISALRRTDQCY